MDCFHVLGSFVSKTKNAFVFFYVLFILLKKSSLTDLISLFLFFISPLLVCPLHWSVHYHRLS